MLSKPRVNTNLLYQKKKIFFIILMQKKINNKEIFLKKVTIFKIAFC